MNQCIANIPEKIKHDYDFTCPICFDKIKDTMISECGHLFCYSCLMTCLDSKKECPICK